VADVARRWQVCPQQVFTWRREMRHGAASSLVRHSLNRVAGILSADPENVDGGSEDPQILRALDAGDEIADGASAIEGGMELGNTIVLRAPAAHATLRCQVDARALNDAVSSYKARIAAAASISFKEVLRLRALLGQHRGRRIFLRRGKALHRPGASYNGGWRR
jgi:transposase-like protein